MKIVHSADISEMGVSHNPEIKKKVFISRGEFPKLMMFGEATFKPGQFVEPHVHETMYEVFYIQSGRAEFVVENEKFIVKGGDCITVDAGENHSQNNPFDENVTWLYFGIATN